MVKVWDQTTLIVTEFPIVLLPALPLLVRQVTVTVGVIPDARKSCEVTRPCSCEVVAGAMLVLLC